jgi:predicted PurR-regulated permease PerM
MNKKIINTIGTLLIILLTILVIQYISGFAQSVLTIIGSGLEIIILSFVIAFAIQPIIKMFRNKMKFNVKVATILANTLFFGVGLLLIALIFPIVVKIISDLSSSGAINNWLNEVKNTDIYYRLTSESVTIRNAIDSMLISAAQSIPSIIQSVLGGFVIGIVKTLFIITLTVYISFDIDRIFAFINYKLKNKKRASKLLNIILEKTTLYYTSIPKYIFFDFILLFLSYYFILRLDITVAIGIALFIAVINTIPYIGGVIATIILLLIALPQGINQIIITSIVCFAIAHIEANIMAPKFFSNKINVNTILVLLVFLLLTPILGFWGVLYGIPIAIIIDVLSKEYLFKEFDKEYIENEK